MIKKILSVFIVGAVILVSPGLASYAAAAGTIKAHSAKLPAARQSAPSGFLRHFSMFSSQGPQAHAMAGGAGVGALQLNAPSVGGFSLPDFSLSEFPFRSNRSASESRSPEKQLSAIKSDIAPSLKAIGSQGASGLTLWTSARSSFERLLGIKTAQNNEGVSDPSVTPNSSHDSGLAPSGSVQDSGKSGSSVPPPASNGGDHKQSPRPMSSPVVLALSLLGAVAGAAAVAMFAPAVVLPAAIAYAPVQITATALMYAAGAFVGAMTGAMPTQQQIWSGYAASIPATARTYGKWVFEGWADSGLNFHESLMGVTVEVSIRKNLPSRVGDYPAGARPVVVLGKVAAAAGYVFGIFFRAVEVPVHAGLAGLRQLVDEFLPWLGRVLDRIKLILRRFFPFAGKTIGAFIKEEYRGAVLAGEVLGGGWGNVWNSYYDEFAVRQPLIFFLKASALVMAYSTFIVGVLWGLLTSVPSAVMAAASAGIQRLEPSPFHEWYDRAIGVQEARLENLKNLGIDRGRKINRRLAVAQWVHTFAGTIILFPIYARAKFSAMRKSRVMAAESVKIGKSAFPGNVYGLPKNLRLTGKETLDLIGPMRLDSSYMAAVSRWNRGVEEIVVDLPAEGLSAELRSKIEAAVRSDFDGPIVYESSVNQSEPAHAGAAGTLALAGLGAAGIIGLVLLAAPITSTWLSWAALYGGAAAVGSFIGASVSEYGAWLSIPRKALAAIGEQAGIDNVAWTRYGLVVDAVLRNTTVDGLLWGTPLKQVGAYPRSARWVIRYGKAAAVAAGLFAGVGESLSIAGGAIARGVARAWNTVWDFVWNIVPFAIGAVTGFFTSLGSAGYIGARLFGRSFFTGIVRQKYKTGGVVSSAFVFGVRMVGVVAGSLFTVAGTAMGLLGGIIPSIMMGVRTGSQAAGLNWDSERFIRVWRHNALPKLLEDIEKITRAPKEEILTGGQGAVKLTSLAALSVAWLVLAAIAGPATFHRSLKKARQDVKDKAPLNDAEPLLTDSVAKWISAHVKMGEFVTAVLVVAAPAAVVGYFVFAGASLAMTALYGVAAFTAAAAIRATYSGRGVFGIPLWVVMVPSLIALPILGLLAFGVIAAMTLPVIPAISLAVLGFPGWAVATAVVAGAVLLAARMLGGLERGFGRAIAQTLGYLTLWPLSIGVGVFGAMVAGLSWPMAALYSVGTFLGAAAFNRVILGLGDRSSFIPTFYPAQATESAARFFWHALPRVVAGVVLGAAAYWLGYGIWVIGTAVAAGLLGVLGLVAGAIVFVLAVGLALIEFIAAKSTPTDRYED